MDQWTGRRQNLRRATVASLLALVLAIPMTLWATAGVGGASVRPRPAKPTITFFSVSPAAFPPSAGLAELLAQVSNATTCTITSNKPFLGMPVTTGCSIGYLEWDFELPTNSTKRVAKYRITLTASGARTTKVSATVIVTSTNVVDCSVIGPDADLAGCDLAGDDLTSTDLIDANVTDTNFTDANLTAVDLGGATVSGANFTGANVTGFSAEKVTGTPAELPAGWRMTVGTLVGPTADLGSASLEDAQLSGIDLTDANLRYADLRNADLSDANLSGADLTGVDTTTVDLTGVIWSDTTCPDGTNSDAHGGTCPH